MHLPQIKGTEHTHHVQISTCAARMQDCQAFVLSGGLRKQEAELDGPFGGLGRLASGTWVQLFFR